MTSSVPPANESEFEVLPTCDGYDRWAALYDGDDNPLVRLEENLFPQLIGDVRGVDALDIGCGTGRQTLTLVRAGAHVTAIDFSEGMLARARVKPELATVRFMVHDAAQPLPFAPESFDRVVSCLVLEHVRDLDGFFREIARVCRRDGAAVLTAMHPAMMLRGVSARFVDPATGKQLRPQSHPNQLSDFVMAATRAGLRFDHMSEHAVNEELAQRSPRSRRYLGYPMLLMMRLSLAPDAKYWLPQVR